MEGKPSDSEKTKTALITGITGQVGPYLAKLLLEKGYIVYGGFRRSSSTYSKRISDLKGEYGSKFHLIQLDITDSSSILTSLKESQPDELYNLAAFTFVGSSFKQPLSTLDTDGIGVLKILEAIRIFNPKIRLFQASSSDMFGQSPNHPQDEKTPFFPVSPYATSKLLAHTLVINYRESYNLHASCGIMFNHESPFRGEEFVTRKITSSVARIKLGKQKVLELGNLDSKRDWGHAQDYCEAMYLIVQQDTADDYAVCTGRCESVRFFVEYAFSCVGIEIEWHGENENEYGTDKKTGNTVVKVNPIYFRALNGALIYGNGTKIQQKMGWKPKIQLEELIKMMISNDLEQFKDAKSE